MSAPVLWWLKKDFRLADNPALMAALDAGETVLPVFLFEPALLEAEETSAFHVAAWCEALTDLRQRIPVLCLRGDAPEALERLRDATGFAEMHSHEEVGSSVTFERDKAVAAWARVSGVAWHEHRQTAVFRGGLDRNKRSALWNGFMKETPLAAPGDADLARIVVSPQAEALQMAEPLAPEAFGHPLADAQAELRQPVSETAAHDTLTDFLTARGKCYSGGISSPNLAFVCGSRLSVHLAWGTLTGRQAYAATLARIAEVKGIESPEAKQWSKSLRSFKSRLHWRDHFIQRLESEPQMEFTPLNPAYEDLPAPGDEHLDAWLEGRTGWPLVDACMRCAAQTGFLNFRMRAMVTSAAVHSLRIDWRKTLYPTARLWADYEPGIHIAQTQMQAGVVGINQLRVYSPNKQLSDHDPEAEFVQRWVPELADTPPEAILKHHERPLADYPAPLVDWWANSKEMKADYYAIKGTPEAKAHAERVYERHGSRRHASSRTWKSNVGRVSKKTGPAKTKKATLPHSLPLFPDE
ncbi:FAD-binding domain-containing protein [Rubricoccus marinus]|uniref:Photolyase/cryptochrome alpha/beta domain-containing protein n=1 Tax=Rubricoccus marinus TaxID=716817 RepID=A0A259TVG8_9BACT|nr:FAD-binding domain-containing protein [Rubricoccus marinus]OZC01696.1 hypothetical protein BSZ36_01080 [Rubricoccus marinus]